MFLQQKNTQKKKMRTSGAQLIFVPTDHLVRKLNLEERSVAISSLFFP